MEDFYPVFEALSNSIYQILSAISQFDIMAINTQGLAESAQFIANAVRLVMPFIKMFVSLISNLH